MVAAFSDFFLTKSVNLKVLSDFVVLYRSQMSDYVSISKFILNYSFG